MEKGIPLLKVDGLSVGYGDITVLNKINITVHKEESVVIFGSNGSGKSTLLKTIAGVISPWNGSIRFNDKDISRMSSYEKLKLGISLASDAKNLFLDMSVEENLTLGAYIKRSGLKERLRQVYEFFPELERIRKKLAGELSGGFQRMLSIGRALMSKPSLLMIDELSLGLSPKVVDRVGEVLKEVSAKEGVSSLVVEQEIYLASMLCQRGYVLDLGTIVAEGDVKGLLAEDVVRRVYMGLW
ncbi:MAG: ABC transporter ATP-binding protein [Aquificaceae bacterium]